MSNRIVVVVTGITSGIAFADMLAVNTALPFIQRSFGVDAADAHWIAEIYLLFVASVMMTGAHFDHASHRQVTCAACHDARESTAASDVLLPQIGKCQSCHGPPSASHLLPTQCVDCHGFHQGHASAVKTGEATR